MQVLHDSRNVTDSLMPANASWVSQPVVVSGWVKQASQCSASQVVACTVPVRLILGPAPKVTYRSREQHARCVRISKVSNLLQHAPHVADERDRVGEI